MAFKDPAIMTARMSSAGSVKASLVEALQSPSSNYRSTVSQDGSRPANNDNVPGAFYGLTRQSAMMNSMMN
jgi:hypothetical protein